MTANAELSQIFARLFSAVRFGMADRKKVQAAGGKAV